MNIEEVSKIIDKIDKSSISYFELNLENCHLKLDKSSTRSFSSTSNTDEEENISNEVYIKNNKEEVEEQLSSEKQHHIKEDKEKDENISIVKSPIVGTFYDAPSPESSKYVSVGDEIKEGDILCIIESMKLMNEIESEENGEIVEILVKNGAMVQFGEPLFKIRRR